MAHPYPKLLSWVNLLLLISAILLAAVPLTTGTQSRHIRACACSAPCTHFLFAHLTHPLLIRLLGIALESTSYLVRPQSSTES